MTMHALTISLSRALRAIRFAAPVLAVLIGIVLAVALASTLLLVFAASAGAALTISAMPPVRRRLVTRRERRRRTLRHDRRDRRLKAADVSRIELAELTAVVESTIGADPAKRDVHDAEALLDRYVELAIARDRIHTELAKARPAVLEARVAAISPQRERTRAVLQRRLEHSLELARRAGAVDSSAADLIDLLHYYCARAAEPTLVLETYPIARALDTYDAAETADLLVEEATKGA